MKNGPAASISLFSYGTLQDRRVQLSTFGRELAGTPDTLSGHALVRVPIHDPAAAAFFGESHYLNAEPSSNPADVISGVLFKITEEELSAADQYECDALYRRTEVTLASGKRAWLYSRQPATSP